MADEPTPEAVEAHLRALDDEIARLRRQGEAIDEKTRRTQAEIRELSRLLADSSSELADRLGLGD